MNLEKENNNMDKYYEKIGKKYREIKGCPFMKFKCANCGVIHYEDCYERECYRNADLCKKCRDVEGEILWGEQRRKEKARHEKMLDFLGRKEELKKTKKKAEEDLKKLTDV